MDVLYWLIPAILVIGIAMVGLLFWTIRSGQYDDPDGAANRILMDEEEKFQISNGTKSSEENRVDK